MMSRFHFPEVSSTQDKAFEIAAEHVSFPFLVTADIQTQGRGRMQRPWIGESGRSLLMTLCIHLPSRQLTGLSLVVGISVAEALRNEGLRVKWPNDLMLEDSKVGGVLVESRSQEGMAVVAIGVGLNLFDLNSAPFHGLNRRVDAFEVAEKMLQYIESFQQCGFSIFRNDYERVMWKRGEQVHFTIEGEIKSVQIAGVTDEGLLMTCHDGKLGMTDQGEIIVES
jgi:biotin-[acetyl-CoA-carboxylase] ligase BirA-like protein